MTDEGISNNPRVAVRSTSGNMSKEEEKMETEEDLLKEGKELEERRAEQVIEARVRTGAVTRARAEKQRLENRTEREKHEDAMIRVERTVSDIEEKYSGIVGGNKTLSTQEKNVLKTWVGERKKDIEEDMETLKESFTKIEGTTEKLAEENERGRWLLEETGKTEVEQILVEWNNTREMAGRYRELINLTLKEQGVANFAQLTQKINDMKERTEEVEKLWRERIEAEEKETKTTNLQIKKLEEEVEEERTLRFNAEAQLQRAIEECKKWEEKQKIEGGSDMCQGCVALEDQIEGKNKEKKREEGSENWSMEFMMEQIKQIRAIQDTREKVIATEECSKNTVRSAKTRTVESNATMEEKGEDRRGERKGGDLAGKILKRETSDSEDKNGIFRRSNGRDLESDRVRREIVEMDSSDTDEEYKRRNKNDRREKGRDLATKLPRLKSYGGEKESWDIFEEGFRVRYEGWDDRVALIMLEESLTGEALKAFKRIPKEERRDGINTVLRWLKKRLSNETPFEELENEKRLIALRPEGKKAVEVCEEIERLVSLLERDKEKQESLMRRHLLLVYEKSKQREKLLDSWSMEESFERMKARLIQMEYMEESKEGIWRGDKKIEYANGGRGRYQNKMVGGIPACNYCGRTGHKIAECRFLKGGETLPNGFRKDSEWTAKSCDHCGKTGHLKDQCFQLYPDMRRPLFNPNAQNFGPPNNQSVVPPNNQGNGSSQTILQRSNMMMVMGREEGKDEEMEVEREDFFIIKKTREVNGEISGIKCRVILDTGAEASLIEEKIVKRMKEVELLPIDERKRLLDAQQNPIDIVGRVILDVQLEIGRKAKIGFFITRSEVGILIGGQGLDAIGVELRAIDSRREEEQELQEESENEWEETEDAKALHDCHIPSGEMKILWVKGDPENIVVLKSKNDAVIEGVAKKEKIVGVPIVNMTESHMIVERNQIIGSWRKLKERKGIEETTGKVARVLDGEGRKIEDKEEWKKIWKKIEEIHEGKLDREVMEILKEHDKVFAIQEEELGRINGYECGIELRDTNPVKQKPRVVPFAIREQLRLLIEKMKKQKVIESSLSPWNSPIVIVRKKDGTIRLCIDYRKVNQQIKLDAHPLPHLETTIQSLAKKKWFTTIDLASGFWQVGLNEEAREVTAFNCLGEHLQFRVLPFGLATSPCLFQRAMQKLLQEEMMKEGEEKKVFCYIDDILIATDTKEEHLETLRWVLRRLEERGVVINHAKCRFLQNSVKYLGHVISLQGIGMEEDKVRAVKEFKRPENTTEVRSFLGLASFNRKFIRNFAKIAGPLHELASTKEKFIWVTEHEKAFMLLKEAVTKAPVLVQPDYSMAKKGTRPFIITTDASAKGIGGVLSQKDEKEQERIIAFHSRSLRGPEKNYSIVDAEALGIYDSVQKWKGIIFGTKVVVRTDHAPLVSMFKRSNVAPRILRWATELMAFDLQIEYVKGKENIVADALSRAPLKYEGLPTTIGEDVVINRIEKMSLEDNEIEEEGEIMRVTTRAQKAVNNEEEVRREKQEEREKWKIEQKKDKWAEEMKKGVEEVSKGNREESQRVEMPHSNMKLTWADLLVEEGILYIKSREHRNLLYVPESMRKSIIKDIHENVLLGHTGSKKLSKLLKREFTWGGIDRDVMEVIKGCVKCKLANAQKKYVPELVPRVAREPLEIVAIDLLDLGRGIGGNRYALVVIDLFSRYAGAYAIKDKRATTVARTFLNNWVLENGRVPKSLLSDNGGEFINETMEEIVKIWKIERKTTLPYHSRANGGVERLNRTLTDIMRRMEGDPAEWESMLPYAIHVYNNTPHSATDETPAFLFNGRDERLPGGNPTAVDERYVIDKEDYVTRIQIMTRRAQKEVNQRLEVEREKMRRVYDKENKNRKLNEPKIGDRVYIKKEIRGELNPKLVIQWEGPYRVMERGTTTAKVKRIDDETEKIVQLDRLRRVPTENGREKERLNKEKKDKEERIEVNIVHYRRVLEKEDPLNWLWSCSTCRPTTLGEIWKGMPEKWHQLEVKNVRDLMMVSAVARMEGRGVAKHYVERKMNEEDYSIINEEDVKVGVMRGLCDHQEATRVEAGRAKFIIEEDMPRRLHEWYRKELGEQKEEKKAFGAFFLIGEGYDILEGENREMKREDWIWSRTTWHNYKEDFAKIREAGVKITVVWAQREASYEILGKLMNELGEDTLGRMRIVLVPPPRKKDAAHPDGVPLLDKWIVLNDKAPTNVRIMIDTNRYNDRSIHMEDLRNAGFGIGEIERLATAIYQGQRLVIGEKKKDDKNCFKCGQGGHFSRNCNQIEKKEEVDQREKEKKGKEGLEPGKRIHKRSGEDGEDRRDGRNREREQERRRGGLSEGERRDQYRNNREFTAKRMPEGGHDWRGRGDVKKMRR